MPVGKNRRSVVIILVLMTSSEEPKSGAAYMYHISLVFFPSRTIPEFFFLPEQSQKSLGLFGKGKSSIKPGCPV